MYVISANSDKIIFEAEADLKQIGCVEKKDVINSISNIANTPVLLIRSADTLKDLCKKASGQLYKYTNKDVVEFMGGVQKLGGHAYAISLDYANQYISNSKDLSGKSRYNLERVACSVEKLAAKKYMPNRLGVDGIKSSSDIRRSGLIGVPINGMTSYTSLPLETDFFGNEIYYRKMPLEHYNHLIATGVLLPTIETSISPSVSYPEKYNGEYVRFTLKKGATKEIINNARAVNKMAQDIFGIEILQKKELQSKAGIKFEGKQVTINLGKGVGLKKFNENIIYFERIG